MTQFLIDLGCTPSYETHDFIVSDANHDAYQLIQQWPQWPAGNLLWLYGPAACGKTHLAHIWASQAHARWLNPARLAANPADLISGRMAVILDGVLPSHDAAHEEALFHLINHLVSHNISALFTHQLAPARLTTRLPDLDSRLKALPICAIHDPDDALLEGLMLKLLSDRQLTVSHDVIAYALKHVDRSYQSVLDFCNKLDHHALQTGRNITLPFAREVLEKQMKSS